MEEVGFEPRESGTRDRFRSVQQAVFQTGDRSGEKQRRKWTDPYVDAHGNNSNNCGQKPRLNRFAA
jgi:hypothetical protein